MGDQFKLFMMTFFIGVSLCGCGSASSKKATKPKEKEKGLKVLKSDCLKKKESMSCSKYAYGIYRKKPNEALSFYKKACDLGDKNSCYTMKSLKSKAIAKNLAIFERSSELVKQCYITFGPKYEGNLNYNNSKAKANYVEYNVSVLISPDGSAGKASVTAKDIKRPIAKLNECMRLVAERSPFIAGDRYQRITLQVKALKQFKTKKATGLGKVFGGILDAMKDMN